ncbi:MAG: hypothetical protein ACRDK9_04460 [Solirubrobacterales bacterium]
MTEMISGNGRPQQMDTGAPFGGVTLRRLNSSDREALERIAERDSSKPLSGRLLGAEVEGVLLAAISLDSGGLIADPFSRTDELRAMLELRAAQLRRRPRFRRFAIRDRHPRAALAASPPGAGGRLLTLLPKP